MLLPNEESFVNFLSVNQKIALEEIKAPAVFDITHKIRKIATKNREIFEKGLRAFVSFIRFYTKHECSLLFRIKDLDIGKLATGYALLKLPKMPELKGKKISNFSPIDINYDEIPYVDKVREKQRQVRLKEFLENPQKRSAISEKRAAKLKAKKLEVKKLLAKKRRRKKAMKFSQEELQDLARDARLVKKFKKGKMSKEEFDAEFAPNLSDIE
ncbi:ATP-dependent RNA helicase DDX55, partial [Stegodyphus mimosarum]